MNLTGFLVKRRNILLAAMTALAVLCALMIPRINVILEITFFLPDDSPMKIGLDHMEEDFPGMRGQLSMLNVMLEDVEDKEAEEKTLSELTGGLVCMSVKDSGKYTLYQFLLTKDCDYKARRYDIKQHYGGSAVVEVDLDKNMPADIAPMLISGALLVFLVLFVMCSSFVEVLLFLLTTLLAVAINMGSNILMGNVSYLTHTMVAVLQMILSMDYSIIIMNRYRQEKLHFPGDNPKAMEVALGRAAPSVMSSAVTTIASLLMLMFMHLKLGVDMGVVLSKGVLCSFICNFTVLPALILFFDKAIVKTEKKIPKIPFKKLARFEVRYRIVLSVLFVGIFVAAFLLQKRTEIAFSAIWETEIGKRFPPQNPMILMYDTEEEDAVPGILDTLQRDPMVESCLSYPGFTKKTYSVAEMTGQFAQMSPMITEELVHTVYYSYTHPERTEKLSINEIRDLAGELSREGLVPDGFDVDALAAKFTVPAPAPVRVAPRVEEHLETPSSETALADTSVISEAKKDSSVLLASAADTVRAVKQTDTAAVEGKHAQQEELLSSQLPRITYEMATEQLTAKEMASRYGLDRSYLNTIFRMAGRTRKPATMSPHEMATFVNNKILGDKRYSGFVNAEQTAMFKEIYRQLDSAFVAGPTPSGLLAQAGDGEAEIPDDIQAAQDSLVHPIPSEDIAKADAAVLTDESPAVEEDDDEPEVITPVERLAEMAFSGRKYSSRVVRNALAAAGVHVSQDDMDLLYMYAGSRKWNDGDTRLTISELVHYLDEDIALRPAFSRFMDEEARRKLNDAREELDMASTTLRSDKHSIAAIITDYEFESTGTFSFLDRFQELADRSLKKEHVIISESAMYKEIKEGFPDEMLLLTVLTVLSIFIIVALTFKSVIIPVMLILAVMSGVYVNVFVSGLGGNTMYFMSYLIVQSILMGATIDYSILFTSYYRENRLRTGVPGAIVAAYIGAGHSIMTSGLILTLGPFAMSLFISDQMIATILKCLASGALSALIVIFLVQPGMIALCDFMVAPKGAVKSFGNK